MTSPAPSASIPCSGCSRHLFRAGQRPAWNSGAGRARKMRAAPEIRWHPSPGSAWVAGLAGDGRVLELAIGTGRVALPLAGRGVAVEGVDASEAMVGRLRAKPGGASVPVVIGDMAQVPVDGPFRLVYLIFNALFGLLTPARQAGCFRGVARVLDPGGVFVIECFVPDLARFDRGQCVRAVAVTEDSATLEVSRHDAAGQQITS